MRYFPSLKISLSLPQIMMLPAVLVRDKAERFAFISNTCQTKLSFTLYQQMHMLTLFSQL